MATEIPTTHDPKAVLPGENTVAIYGIQYPNLKHLTTLQILMPLGIDRDAARPILAKLRDAGAITPLKLGTGIRYREISYSISDAIRIIPHLITIQPGSPQTPKFGSPETGSNEKPGNFFALSDRSIIKGISPVQRSLLELTVENAKDGKPTTFRDVAKKGIRLGTTAPEVNNLFAHLHARLDPSPWRLINVPDYRNPETQKPEYAFTLIKIEPQQNKKRTKEQLDAMKKQMLKQVAINMLNQILRSEINISYNVRLLLGESDLLGKDHLTDIFGEVTDHDLNDMFINTLRPVSKKTKNADGEKEAIEEPQPEKIDPEIQRKLLAIHKERLVDDPIGYIERNIRLREVKIVEKKYD